jgi:hypothetical protein
VHLDAGKDRHVVGFGHREQRAGLVFGEHLHRAGLGAAVDAPPGDLVAPLLRPGLGISQVHELLTGEEVAPYVLNSALHTRLVFRAVDSRSVGGEPAVLRIVQPADGEVRVDRIGVGDNR